MCPKTFSGRSRSRRGFSLVVSLVMMALMLMIVITLVSFVYVQSKLTESRIKRTQAQLNAISGMRIALGQLQLLTGDDQRVTATADIFGDSGNESLPSGEPTDGKRFWTGVWATGGLDKSKIRDWSVYNPNKKPFLGWLVSDYDSSKEVYSPNENPVSSSTASTNSSTLLKVVQDAFTYDDEKIDIITLVGAGSLGENKDAADEYTLSKRQVKVRRVALTKFSAASTEAIRPTTGGFAYWVGDEGVKARVNIPDDSEDAFLKNSDWDRLFNTVAHRNGVSLIDGLENFDNWWDKDAAAVSKVGSTRLGYVTSVANLPLYAEAVGGANADTIQENAQKLFHDISFSSTGIFTDTYNGGLKTDLSLAFEMPWFSESGWTKGFRDYKQFHGSGETNEMNLKSKFTAGLPSDEKWWTTQPSDGLGYLYEIATGESQRNGTSEMSYLRGPTWDLVRNYYRLYKREDEEKGFRGLTPKNSDSWIAIGSRPYTYLSGHDTQTQSSDGSQGWLGEKYNYSTIVTRHPQADAGRYSALLPEFSGKSHSRPGSAQDNDKASPNTYHLPIPQSMRISPIVRRVVIRCSVILNQDTAAICLDPIVTIHNPYNVPIEFFGFGTMWTKFFPFGIKFIREDVDEDGEARVWPNTSSTELTVLNPASASASDIFMTNKPYGYRILTRVFAGTTSFSTSPSGTIRMMPGEVKVMFPASSEAALSSVANTIGSLCNFEYNDKSAAARDISSISNYLSTIQSEGSLNFRVEVLPITGSSACLDLDLIPFYLFYPRSSNNVNLANTTGLKRSWGNVGSTFSDVPDTSDYDLTQVVSFRRYFDNDGGTITADGTFEQTSESGVTNPNKQYFAYIDVRHQGTDSSSIASPRASNARPWIVDPSGWDADMTERNSGLGWKKTVEKDTLMNPVEYRNEEGFWGDGVGTGDGQSNIVLFEIPTAPLTSLGQLQHVECSVLDMEPSYVIGNSYAHVGFKDSELDEVLVWPSAGYMKSGQARYSSTQSPQPRGDTPFAANLQLFDHYFFSGINYGSADSGQESTITSFIEKVFSTSESRSPFPNARIELIRDFGDRKESEVKEDFKDAEKVARNLTYKGAFNVNSTSVEAWMAVLAGLNGQAVKIDGKFKEISNSPVIRFMNVIGSGLGGYSNKTSIADNDGDDGNGWRWYATLSDDEVRKIAEKIVDEVRARGPFMSLSDFVNRRLDTGDNGKAGAIQTAIDNSGVNKTRASGFGDGSGSNPDSTRYPNLFPTNAKFKKAGIPGYITQGDILSNIGASLTARSDTFTIRAYGDVAGISGNPEARAWCEAVVQRFPEFIDPQDDEDDEMIDVVEFRQNYRNKQNDSVTNRGDKYVLEKWSRNDDLSAVNKLFGRRYKIVSFRWLSQDEL